MATLGNLHVARLAPEIQSDASVNNGKREMTIGEMASEFNVSLRTLRFYEDRKLLRPRREGNTRLYSVTDRLRMQMIVKGKQLDFTATEFKLLALLMERRGRVQSRDTLLNDVWGYENIIDTRTVDTHIRRLREKLGKSSDCIETVRGFGYRIAEAGR